MRKNFAYLSHSVQQLLTGLLTTSLLPLCHYNNITNDSARCFMLNTPPGASRNITLS